MKTITVHLDKCTGCRVCELACSLKHTGEFNPARSRIQVMGFDEVFCLPVMCYQCDRPYCMEVCPAGAITRDEDTGVVRVSQERCVGCKMCVVACPFGNIVVSSDEKKAAKCELCDGEPECVAFCTTGALQFKEAELAALDKKRALSDKLRDIYTGVSKKDE